MFHNHEAGRATRLAVTAIAAASMSWALAGCALLGSGDDDYVPTTDDIIEARDEEARKAAGQDGQAQQQGGAAGTTDAAPQAQGGGLQHTQSSDGQWSTDDFFEGSGIYNTSVAHVSNDYVFAEDAVGAWTMVALLDDQGQVMAGVDVSQTGLTIRADGTGIMVVDGAGMDVSWTQYKDFPQVAMGVIDNEYIVTMELNDSGRLTVRQDIDGQMMLYARG